MESYRQPLNKLQQCSHGSLPTLIPFFSSKWKLVPASQPLRNASPIGAARAEQQAGVRDRGRAAGSQHHIDQRPELHTEVTTAFLPALPLSLYTKCCGNIQGSQSVLANTVRYIKARFNYVLQTQHLWFLL